MDQRLFLRVHAWSGRWWMVDRMFSFVATKGPILMVLWIMVYQGVLLLSGAPVYRVGFAILASVVSAGITRGVHVLIRLRIKRDRPFVALQLCPLIPHRPDGSFPSNHAGGAFALLCGMLFFSQPLAWLLLLAALWLAFSRVYVGLHYPSDVLIGAVVGSCVGIGVGSIVCHLLAGFMA